MAKIKVLEERCHEDNKLSNGILLNGSYPKDGYVYTSEYHINNFDKISLIAEIEVDIYQLEEEKIVDYIKDGKKILNYQIHVYSGEGPTPHFHIIQPNGGKNRVDTCLCIYEHYYFTHGVHNTILSRNKLKMINNFLKTIIDPSNDSTYWNYISMQWFACNKDNKIKYPNVKTSKEQPDYTNILGTKSDRKV